MKYKELVVRIDSAYYDELIAFLLTLDFEGFIEGDDALYAYIQSDKFSDPLIIHIRERLRYFPVNENTDSPMIDFCDVAYKNWQEDWQRSLSPIHICTNIVVHQTWYNPEKVEGVTYIAIDPKMSFGTGHHETTQMMVELLQEFHKPGMTILDAGTGSGILAIIAAKLGAKSVVGIDNDPDAVTDANVNIALNGVDNKVQILSGNVDIIQEIKSQTFDMVLANIERKVIMNFFDTLSGCVNKRGLLVLSGLLADDLPAIEKISSMNKMSILKTLKRTSNTSDEWVAVVLEK
jgi:ribosomal protein L11 methyltransferase